MNIQILSARLTTKTSGKAVFTHGNSRMVVCFKKHKTAVFADTAIIGGKDVTDSLSSVEFLTIERSIAQNLQQQQAEAIDRTEVQYSRLNELLQRPAVLSVIAMSTLAIVGVFGGMA